MFRNNLKNPSDGFAVADGRFLSRHTGPDNNPFEAGKNVHHHPQSGIKVVSWSEQSDTKEFKFVKIESSSFHALNLNETVVDSIVESLLCGEPIEITTDQQAQSNVRVFCSEALS